MTSDVTKEALGLLAAVQDPKAVKKNLQDIQKAQAELEKARKEHAEERRECAKIRLEQKNMAETDAKLKAYAIELRATGEKLDERKRILDQQAKDLANIEAEHKAAEKRAAYAKRKLKELDKATLVLAEKEKKLLDIKAKMRVALAEATADLEREG